MDADKLKMIATFMGYEVTKFNNGYANAIVYINNDPNIYNPLENDSQLLEIIVKMKIDISHLTETIRATHIDETLSATNSAERETINEAVLAAAIAFIEDK